MTEKRTAAVAGSFYPSDPAQIKELLEEYMENASPPDVKGKLRGLIVPHAGYIYSGPVAAYGYKMLAETKPSRIILMGPSHFAMFDGLAESGQEVWETPLGDVPTFSIGRLNEYPAAHAPEHSLEVQLPFLQMAIKDFEVDPILTGAISPSAGADALEDEEAFLLISSDLSHYMPYEDAVGRDKETIKLIEALDLEGFMGRGDACGKAAIAIAMELAKRKGWAIKLLHYANSGDTAGPKSGVVGYAAMAIVEG